MQEAGISAEQAIAALGQIAITSLMWYGGIRIRTLPFTAGTQPLGDAASYALTMFWALGLTNGINFIDAQVLWLDGRSRTRGE